MSNLTPEQEVAASENVLATSEELARALRFDSTAVFAHAANSKARLSTALAQSSPCTFVEVDVRLRVTEAVCAHDAREAATSDLAFADAVALCASGGQASASASAGAGAGASAGAGAGAGAGPEPGATLARRGKARGLKADVKEWAALGPVLEALKTYLARSSKEDSDPTCPPLPLLALRRGPATLLVPALVVNADVLTGGPGAPLCTFNGAGAPLPTLAAQIEEARTFLEAVVQATPLAVVSPGWTTEGEGRGCAEEAGDGLEEGEEEGEEDEGHSTRGGRKHAAAAGVGGGPEARLQQLPRYTDAMVDAMLAVVDGFADAGVHFTFPVRASYVRDSLGPLQRLLGAVPGASLTVWSNARLPASQEAWLRDNLDPERTAWDLPGRVEEEEEEEEASKAAAAAAFSASGGGGESWLPTAAELGAATAVAVGVFAIALLAGTVAGTVAEWASSKRKGGGKPLVAAALEAFREAAALVSERCGSAAAAASK